MTLRERNRSILWAPIASIPIAWMLMASTVWAGPLINQFEVKGLESEAGSLEVESQSSFSSGQPRRRFIDTTGDGDFVFDDNTAIRQNHEIGLGLGITDWLKIGVGIEFEQERLDDPGGVEQANAFGDLKLDQLQFEGVLVILKPKKDGIGLGLFIEYGHPVPGDVEAPGELFFGPILEANSGPWSMTANLALIRQFGGSPAEGNDEFVRDNKWDFSYSVQTKYSFSEQLALAIEAYGTFDRLGNSGNRSQEAVLFGDFDQHRVGPVLYWTLTPNGHDSSAKPEADKDGGDDKELEVTIGTGVLFGLNDNTADATYKLSLEVGY